MSQKKMIFTDTAGKEISYDEAKYQAIVNVRIDDEAQTITLEVAPAQA